jgi:hypothetical protein
MKRAFCAHANGLTHPLIHPSPPLRERVPKGRVRGLNVQCLSSGRNFHGAELVRRLSRVGIERRVSELVGDRIVHWNKDLAGLNGMGHEGQRRHTAATRRDLHAIASNDVEPSRIARIDFDIGVVGIKLPEHSGLGRARLRVPLGSRAAAGQQNKRIFATSRFAHRSRRFEQEPGLSVSVIVNAILEQASRPFFQGSPFG